MAGIQAVEHEKVIETALTTIIIMKNPGKLFKIQLWNMKQMKEYKMSPVNVC